MKTLIALVALLLLVGCGGKTTVRPEYAAYLEQVQTAQAKREAQAQGIASAAECPPNDGTCVVAVKALAAMAVATQQAPQIAPPPRERDFAEQVGSILSGLSPLAGAAVSWRQSDNARDISIAQYGFLEGIVRSTGETAVAITQAGPRIEVGGNLGDTYGDDYTGGDRTDVGGDQIGGDRVSDSVVGNGNRIESPDDSFNGGNCTSAPGGAGGTTGAGNTGTATGGPSAGCSAGNGGG